MADLDHFKHINDTYGHLVGDDVLRDAAKIMQKHLGKKDILGRYGGEEFIIVLRGADEENAKKFADSLCLALQESKILGEKRDVTISLGVSTFPNNADTVKYLVAKADKALYIAKRTGRNKAVMWQDNFEDTPKTKKHNQEFFYGDSTKDAVKMRSLYKIISTTAQNLSFQEKMVLCLNEAKSVSSANDLMFFLVDKGVIVDVFHLNQDSLKRSLHNSKIVQDAIDTQQTICLIDWDNEKIKINSGIYDWQSIIAAPAIKDGQVIGVIYASVSIKEKEFSDAENGYISSVATIIASIAR